MLPVAGYLITRLLGSETTGSCSRTYVDQVIDIIWKVIGFAALLVGSLAVLLIIRIPVTFTILLMIGMGIAITSLILRFTPGIAGGTARDRIGIGFTRDYRPLAPRIIHGRIRPDADHPGAPAPLPL